MGEHMPRLHPEDLKELKSYLKEELACEIQQLNSKENTISELQTFTLKEAAKILSTTPATLRDHAEKGLFDAVKLGRYYIVPQQAIIKKLNGK